MNSNKMSTIPKTTQSFDAISMKMPFLVSSDLEKNQAKVHVETKGPR